MINLEKIEIYKLACEVGKEVRELTKVFPKEEKYVMIPQIKRAVTSIGANIAEGAGKKTKTDRQRFLFIARGSLNETRFYIELAKELKFISLEIFLKIDDKLDKLGRMITLFIKNSSKNTRINP